MKTRPFGFIQEFGLIIHGQHQYPHSWMIGKNGFAEVDTVATLKVNIQQNQVRIGALNGMDGIVCFKYLPAYRQVGLFVKQAFEAIVEEPVVVN